VQSTKEWLLAVASMRRAPVYHVRSLPLEGANSWKGEQISCRRRCAALKDREGLLVYSALKFGAHNRQSARMKESGIYSEILKTMKARVKERV
jgi:hypothetical protein